ncbi:MAG: universal stress protein [Desulfovibrionaceae bacterium]
MVTTTAHDPQTSGIPTSNGETRRLLLTVSENASHLYSVRFVSQFFSNTDKIDLTLLYITPPKTTPMVGPKGIRSGDMPMDEETIALREQQGMDGMNAARTILGASGHDLNALNANIRPQQVSKVWDIINEGVTGRYDAIILGNRGRSRLDDILEGRVNVNREILENSCRAPLWICSEVASDARNVLLCVDGSDAAYRMTEHVGDMLSIAPDQKVTLMRVTRESSIGPSDPHRIFTICMELLRKRGVSEDRISTKAVWDNDVVGTILREAHHGGYAVVAAGRTGVGGGLMQSLFMGSVAKALFRKLSGAALWVRC